MDHHFRVALEVPSKDMKYIEYGSRPTGIYIPRFRNVYNDKETI
jgi:hypothetical protein